MLPVLLSGAQLTGLCDTNARLMAFPQQNKTFCALEDRLEMQFPQQNKTFCALEDRLEMQFCKTGLLHLTACALGQILIYYIKLNIVFRYLSSSFHIRLLGVLIAMTITGLPSWIKYYAIDV